MVTIKTEVFPNMANPSNSRNRTFETAEKHIFCPEDGCAVGGTWRKIRNHWNDDHSTGDRRASVTCTNGSCTWYCFNDNLTCFTKHTKAIHSIRPNADTDFTVTGRIPRKNVNHSQHCNASSAEAKALAQERAKQKRREAAAVRKLNRQARRVKPKNPVIAAVTHTTEVVETQNINISTTGDVNIQVTKTTVRERRQNRDLDRVLDRLADAPYVGERVVYTDDEDDVSENATTNTTEETTANEVVDITGDEENIHTEKPEPIITIDSDSDEDYEIFDDVEIEEGDVIIELGVPEIHSDWVPSESESEAESTDSEDDIPLVNLNKRKMKPIIRSNLKKARGN